MPESSSSIFKFGAYESHPQTRELFKHGSKLKVRPQPLQLLNLLLSRAGDVLTREELRKKLWSSETFVDFEHGLNNSVKELRAILGDSAAEPRYIQTLPKLGYRFIAPVEVAGPAMHSIPMREPEDASSSAQPSPGAAVGVSGVVEVPTDVPIAAAVRPRFWRSWVVPGLAAILVVMVVGYFQWSRSRTRPQPISGRIMLAVLPFENLTGDAGQDYFSDGLTEEMIAQLGRLDPEHLGVIARTSVMHYKHGEQPLDQIGRELGVQYVLEGSVRRDADKVRITAQLIQVKDQTHLWSRQYDRELTHLLTLQGEIAQETAGEIQNTLGNNQKSFITHVASSPALSPEAFQAYDLYLKGRYFWNKRTLEGFQQSVDFFQQAIAKDPNYARAYSGLADSYSMMSAYYNSLFPANEIMPKARAAATKAVQLDEGLAEAHTSLAVIAQNYDWDRATAEKEYRRAIQLDPNYATAHHWYAEFLGLQGRFDEALVEMGRARHLDPLSLIIASDNGVILFFSRQYDAAMEQFRGALDMDPGFPRAHMLVYVYVQKGMFAEAIASVQKWRGIDDPAWNWAETAYVYGRSGQESQARRALQMLEQLNQRRQADAATFVTAYIGMDNKEEALAWLQKAYLEHSPSLTALKVDPLYDPLRGAPRFQGLLRRVGLAP